VTSTIDGMMRAAVLVGPGRFEVQPAPRPAPGPTQVRVRIEGCGVCGSNLSAWQGRPWLTYPMSPGAPGHEAWGRVDAVGEEVRCVLVGDRVAGLSQRGFAEYEVFDQDGLVRIPGELDSQPVPAEPLACAVNVLRRSGVVPDSTVAVVGVGFLGAVVTRLAAASGARALAVSRRPFSRELGTRMGAARALDVCDPAVVDQVMELTSGRGCDVVIEAAGAQETLDLAGKLTRERGRLVIAGFHQDGPRHIDMSLWNQRGLDVVNAHERAPAAYVAGMETAVMACARGEIDVRPLFSHQIPLDRIGDAFRALEARDEGFVKALVMA
jgi:2-desacetyl-2-hydroxyethyl bacteriochlorophyllide A dehydrogenase